MIIITWDTRPRTFAETEKLLRENDDPCTQEFVEDLFGFGIENRMKELGYTLDENTVYHKMKL